MKRIAVYSRKSRETDKGESIKNQIEMCKEYFFRQNYKCEFEVFEDEGFSGSNTNRPEFQRMMLLAKHNQFDIIACYKVDRISRNIVDFMNTFDILEKHNVSLVSISEGFDPSTPVGRIMMTMLAGFAEMERMNIAQRVRDNLLSLAKIGRWSGGTPPTGYKSIRVSNGDKTAMYLELIPEWEDKLKFIYKSVSNGNTIRHTSKILNMPNKTVASIISNPTYCQSDPLSKQYLEKIGYEVFGDLNGSGYLSYNRRPKTKNGKKKFNAKGMFVSVSKHKAPIDSETWISANEKVKSRGDQAKPRISQYSPLAHLVKCSCGSGMYIEPGNRRKDGSRNYYFCCSKRKIDKLLCESKWINAIHLEEDLLETLKSISIDENILNSYIDKRITINLDHDIKTLKRKILLNNNKLNSLTEKLILLEGNALNLVADKMNEISRENDNLNQDLLKLERENLLNNFQSINIQVLKENIKKLLSEWAYLSIESKQAKLNILVKEIVWDGEKNFDIKFNI